MATCEDIHKQYDRFANGPVQAGELPPWMHVHGRVAWYVYAGPYRGLSEGWGTFMRKAHAAHGGELAGPPGDVYVCDPADHEGEAEAKLITIMWAPLKE